MSRTTSVFTHYNEAGHDYKAWSKSYNMHFGYWRRWLNPFNRERMLEEMSAQVFRRLKLLPDARVLDLGCGLGAPARTLVRLHSVQVTGVAIVPAQIEQARQLTLQAGLSERVRFHLGDYTKLEMPSAETDAAFSIEASCHDAGPAKAAFIKEAARLLKPGGRLVIADAFTTRRDPGPAWWRRAMKVVTDYWALECFADLGHFQDALTANGFKIVGCEEIGWRIVPSVLHIPWVTLKFLFQELLLKHSHLNKVRWGHVHASICSPFVGILRNRFGYYLITAEKQ